MSFLFFLGSSLFVGLYCTGVASLDVVQYQCCCCMLAVLVCDLCWLCGRRAYVMYIYASGDRLALLPARKGFLFLGAVTTENLDRNYQQSKCTWCILLRCSSNIRRSFYWVSDKIRYTWPLFGQNQSPGTY